MRKKTIILFLWLASCIYAHGQPSIAKSVVASGGGTTTVGNLSLSYTIAELSRINTIIASPVELYEGFQNDAYGVIQSVTADVFTGEDLTVYPNPAGSTFYLNNSNPIKGDYMLLLNDMLGQSIKSWRVSGFNTRSGYDVSSTPEGTYTLTVYDITGKNKFNQLISIIH